MSELKLVNSKPLRNGEVLELYHATSHRQTVYRLVWTKHDPRITRKPIIMDYVDYTKEINAIARFERTR